MGCLLINKNSPKDDKYPEVFQYKIEDICNSDENPREENTERHKYSIANTYYDHKSPYNPAKILTEFVRNMEAEIKSRYKVETVVKKSLLMTLKNLLKMTNKIKSHIFVVFALSTFSCNSQIKGNHLLIDFKKEFDNVDFEFLLFFQKEIVSVCTDSIVASKFSGLLNSYKTLNKKTENDIRESRLVLNILYNKIYAIEPTDQLTTVSKKSLLNILEGYKNLDFSINKELINNQIDGTKRNLVNGYQEGTVTKSWLIFFYFNPILFKSVLIDSGMEKSWQKAELMLCNIFRQNELPLSFRNHLKDEVIVHLHKYKGEDKDIESLIEKFKKCDVSKNLYD